MVLFCLHKTIIFVFVFGGVKADIAYYGKYDSPVRTRTLVSCIQGTCDNHYTTEEPTVIADEIAQLIVITSLRSWDHSLNFERLISLALTNSDLKILINM